MRTLKVYIEIRGEQHPVGRISDDGTGNTIFTYSDEYLADPEGAAISVSLPLQREAFASSRTKCFFEGLLPEGFTRRSVAQWMHVDAEDYLSILAGLGSECLGAVRIADEDEADAGPGYAKLSDEEVLALAREGATTSAQIVTKSHLSLTGASGKVGLYYDESGGSWYMPRGMAASTHIVKQSHIRLDSIVVNEQLALMTAARLGLDVPRSFILNMGNGADEDVLFATRRYDRQITETSRLVDGLPCPSRLHQEDFAQALGIPAANKYEQRPRGYMRAMFDLLRRRSADPIHDQLKLWDTIVFDFLVGNTDSHLKNVSLLYSADLLSVRLAPVYDIVSTAVYESSTRDMAFFIGGTCSLDELGRKSFGDAAREVGLGRRMALGRFDDLCGRFEKALEESSKELSALGFVQSEKLRKRILRNGGIRRV